MIASPGLACGFACSQALKVICPGELLVQTQVIKCTKEHPGAAVPEHRFSIMYSWPGSLNRTKSTWAINKGIEDPQKHQQNLRKLETGKERQTG